MNPHDVMPVHFPPSGNAANRHISDTLLSHAPGQEGNEHRQSGPATYPSADEIEQRSATTHESPPFSIILNNAAVLDTLSAHDFARLSVINTETRSLIQMNPRAQALLNLAQQQAAVRRERNAHAYAQRSASAAPPPPGGLTLNMSDQQNAYEHLTRTQQQDAELYELVLNMLRP